MGGRLPEPGRLPFATAVPRIQLIPPTPITTRLVRPTIEPTFHVSRTEYPPKAPKGTQSVQRTMGLLDAFAPGESWLELKEIAERVELPKPTAHRILNALASTGLIESEGGRYRLGPSAAELGLRAALAQQDSPHRATPFAGPSFARNSSLAVREWNGAVGVDRYEPTFEREYWAIRHGAAVLDVSPLFLYEFEGPEAEAAMQRLVTRDVTRCRVDQVMYTAWCNDEGFLLQDGNLIRLGERCFRLSAAEPSLRWFEDVTEDFDVSVRDVGDGVAKLAVQGPLSRDLLLRVLSGETESFTSLRYFHGCQMEFEGRPVYVTRTGFTGDLGYELWMDLEQDAAGHRVDGPAHRLWNALLDSDLGPSVVPMGLAALDAARIEAGLILIDVDYFSASHCLLASRRTSPDESGLGWAVKLVGGNDFVGRRAIEAERQRGVAWRFVGIAVDWDELERVFRPAGLRPDVVGKEPRRQPQPVFDETGKPVGQLTSMFYSPLVKKLLVLADVHADVARPGTSLGFDLRVEMERLRVVGRVTKLPFYDPPHKRSTS